MNEKIQKVHALVSEFYVNIQSIWNPYVHYIETSQSMYTADQLNGLHVFWAFA